MSLFLWSLAPYRTILYQVSTARETFLCLPISAFLELCDMQFTSRDALNRGKCWDSRQAQRVSQLFAM